MDAANHGAVINEVYRVLGRNHILAEHPLELSRASGGAIVIRIEGGTPLSETIRRNVINELANFRI